MDLLLSYLVELMVLLYVTMLHKYPGAILTNLDLLRTDVAEKCRTLMLMIN